MYKFYGKLLFLVLMSALFVTPAFAESKLLKDEAESVQSSLPMTMSVGLTFTALEYKSGKGFIYTYVVGSAAALTADVIKSRYDAAFTMVCSLPYTFVNALIKDKTPITYNYVAETDNKSIGSLTFDMKKCADLD